MSSAYPTSFLIRATPLTFALLWSSGFIVAKYAAPYADPFTFLSARFGLAALILVAIAAAMRAPWPTRVGGIVHSLVAGVRCTAATSGACGGRSSRGCRPRSRAC